MFYSLYTFDMRALDTPVMVHLDHVSAVLDVDYSPTGKEFVSASFDKSIRIFPVDKSRSRYVCAHQTATYSWWNLLLIIIYLFLEGGLVMCI